MPRRLIISLLLTFWAVSAVSATAAPSPKRIISLAPGTTEMLFALGLGKQIVGDTVYCNYPPAARTIAKIGDVNVNYEKVISLHPDLIVASDANTAATVRLRQLHLPVLVITPTSYAATERSLLQLGRATGTTVAANHIVAHMEAVRRDAAQSARTLAQPTVLPILGIGPLYVAGSGTFIGDLISLAGGRNSAGAITGYAPYSLEMVIAHPANFILADAHLQAALHADPIMGRLPAVRSGHFIIIDPDILSRPGPRLADGLLQLSRALHAGGK